MNRLAEIIEVPIKVGDTILGGRFKNKKVLVKDIGTDDHGGPTINGRPLLKYRMIKKDEGMSKLEKVLAEADAKLEFSRLTTEHIKKHGFKPTLQGFIFALDAKDSTQKKALDALTRIAIF